jgi:hypothetical protein
VINRGGPAFVSTLTDATGYAPPAPMWCGPSRWCAGRAGPAALYAEIDALDNIQESGGLFL